MGLEKRLLSVIKKVIYGLFILWVGGLTPLIHLNAFAMSHPLPRYRLALFARPLPVQEPLPDRLPDQILRRLEQHRLKQVALLSPPGIAAHLAEFVQAAFSTGYLLVDASALVPPADYRRLDQAFPATGRSAWLPPPEKPPPFRIDSPS